jgi:DNA-binding protein HU-beta
VTKKELAEKTAQDLASMGKQHITKTQVEAVMDALGKVAAAELLEGGEVPLPGLGKLKAKHLAAKKGRNPKTGEDLDIPARTGVKFVPGKELKDLLK